MERKIQYLESKVEMSAHNPTDMTVGGDRVVIGAPINLQRNIVQHENEEDGPSMLEQYGVEDESPTQDETSYTEDVSESLAC